MASYETERILSALRVALMSTVVYDKHTECPALDIFEQVYDHIKEQNDTELLHSLGLVIPKMKCKGCDRKKGMLDLD